MLQKQMHVHVFCCYCCALILLMVTNNDISTKEKNGGWHKNSTKNPQNNDISTNYVWVLVSVLLAVLHRYVECVEEADRWLFHHCPHLITNNSTTSCNIRRIRYTKVELLVLTFIPDGYILCHSKNA